MKMGSPAVKAHKRASKSFSSSSEKSQINMTESELAGSFTEGKFFSWLRLFRFVSLLSRQE